VSGKSAAVCRPPLRDDVAALGREPQISSIRAFTLSFSALVGHTLSTMKVVSRWQNAAAGTPSVLPFSWCVVRTTEDRLKFYEINRNVTIIGGARFYRIVELP